VEIGTNNVQHYTVTSGDGKNLNVVNVRGIEDYKNLGIKELKNNADFYTSTTKKEYVYETSQ